MRSAMTNYPPGFTCESVTLRLELYVMQKLPRAELLAIAEHLEACDQCPQRLALLRAGSHGRSRD